ncbi:hypothetical protein STANM309S_04961 [Streptomyces tanashiensis]
MPARTSVDVCSTGPETVRTEPGAKWLRLDAWTTNKDLQAYYLRQGFEHVRTVLEGAAMDRCWV